MPPDFPGADPTHPDLPAGDPGQGTQQQPQAAEPTEPSSAAAGERLIFGKYRSMEEAERGLYETTTSAAAVHEMNRRLVDQNQKLAEIVARQTTKPAEPTGDPLDELRQWAVPVEPIRKAIEAHAQRIADAAVEKRLGPLAEGLRARQQVEQRIPEFAKRESEISRFIASSPELTERYNRAFQADPSMAMEWAYLVHEATVPKRRSAAAPSAQASLPSGGAGQGQRTQPPEDPMVQIRAGQAAYEQSGDAMDLVRPYFRLRGIITDEHVRPGRGV